MFIFGNNFSGKHEVENELENLKEQIRKVEQELERVKKENTILIETETNINEQLDGQKSRVAQLERELKESQEKVKDLEGLKIKLFINNLEIYRKIGKAGKGFQGQIEADSVAGETRKIDDNDDDGWNHHNG